MKEKKVMTYDERMHRTGRISMSVMLALMIAVPFLVTMVMGEWFRFTAGYWAAFISLLIQLVPSGIIEVITYAPMLGTGGTYIAFITGNLINLKIPCVMNAREITKSEIGTEQNEVVSTIAVSVSAIVTTVVLAVGVMLITPLTPLLESPVLVPAFKTVVTALFGAMGYTYFRKYPKVAVIPWTLGVLVFLLDPALTSMVSIMVVVLAVISMGLGLWMHKKGWV